MGSEIKKGAVLLYRITGGLDKLKLMLVWGEISI